MHVLDYKNLDRVAGGVDNAEANQRVGDALGAAAHAMSSTEAFVGSVFGLGGFIAGAIIHMTTKH